MSRSHVVCRSNPLAGLKQAWLEILIHLTRSIQLLVCIKGNNLHYLNFLISCLMQYKLSFTSINNKQLVYYHCKQNYFMKMEPKLLKN